MRIRRTIGSSVSERHSSVPVRLHLPPGAAGDVLADRAAEQDGKRTTDALRALARHVVRRDQCVGGLRQPLIRAQILALPFHRLVLVDIEARSRSRDLGGVEGPVKVRVRWPATQVVSSPRHRAAGHNGDRQGAAFSSVWSIVLMKPRTPLAQPSFDQIKQLSKRYLVASSQDERLRPS
ncbi:hypothetical protein AJ88_25295 [Mesorhizobium amorphae CCBAU 01583]|nr:hypothetical protein AJ88_25295 [Mesorhizobium amorphae CCBAU 01583]